jgi:crossover junction endodeoxyribonuclease RuvC
MIVLGVDPGTLCTGFGIVRLRHGRLSKIAYGAVKNRAGDEMPRRLYTIYEQLTQIIKEFDPDEFAIESAFYGKNVQSALKLGHARGVSILAAVQHNLPTSEYSPREIKRALVGNGAASKNQVAYMVRRILSLNDDVMLHDSSDALAVAVCHINRIASPATNRRFKDWKSFVDANPEKVAR